MAEIAMVLMTLSLPGSRPGVAQAAKALGVQPDAIDKSFGVIAIDPEKKLYAVQVRATDLPQSSGDKAFNGPFANPRIAPFGPPGG